MKRTITKITTYITLIALLVSSIPFKNTEAATTTVTVTTDWGSKQDFNGDETIINYIEEEYSEYTYYRFLWYSEKGVARATGKGLLPSNYTFNKYVDSPKDYSGAGNNTKKYNTIKSKIYTSPVSKDSRGGYNVVSDNGTSFHAWSYEKNTLYRYTITYCYSDESVTTGLPENTKSDVDRIIEVAIAEVGYIEKSSNNNLYDFSSSNNNTTKNKYPKGNYTKYAADFDQTIGYSGHAPEWCSLFIWWCAYKAGLVDSGVFPAGKNNSGSQPIFSAAYFPKYFTKVSDPIPGDLVYYNFSGKAGTISHIGLIVATDDNYIYTVEGNTTPKMGSKKSPYYHEFDKSIKNDAPVVVQSKTHRRTDSSIVGYVRPNYSN